MGDLDGDGRSARVDGQRNTVLERQLMRRLCATAALTTPNPQQDLRQLLDQIDLWPKKGEEP